MQRVPIAAFLVGRDQTRVKEYPLMEIPRCLRLDFVTLFPEMVLDALGHSIPKRAEAAGLVAFSAINPRDFTTDVHRTVDDSPYGGGPGMVIKVEPIALAIEALVLEPGTAVVLTDPTGIPFTQAHAHELATKPKVVFLCGHYEGFDRRIEDLFATHVFSIGDFVLTGGELPALVMADAVIRLLPGALGCAESLEIDSHREGLLSAPQYTRPEEFRGMRVPPVLLSGNHAEIRKWRRREALLLTRSRRPDLWASVQLSKEDRRLIDKADETTTSV
jgi:tRNA (guanine37-N1)-methyltransferase